MSGETAGATPPPAGAPRPPGLLACFLGLGALWVVLVAVSSLLRKVDLAALGGSWAGQAGGVVGLAVLGVVLWEIRRWLMRTVTSLAFSTALLGSILVFTALGTVILQQAPAPSYGERYGQALAAVLLFLGCDDIFHTPWFGSFLALVGISLVLTAIEKRAWRVQWWGHMLSHLGFVTVLVGGFIGSRWGFKGFIDIHEGQVVHEAVVTRPDGSRGGSHPLGFGLKLERFAVEHYQPEAKFYVYERNGEEYRTVAVHDLRKDLSAGGPLWAIGASGASFRLVKAYPDFELTPEVRPAPVGQGGPVLQIDFQDGDWKARAALQPQPGRNATKLSAQGQPLRFVQAAPTEQELAGWAKEVPAVHLLTVRNQPEAAPVAVTIGQSVLLEAAGIEVEALEFLPDFSYDAKAKKATSRSNAPNNPALQVRITDRKTGQSSLRWLFAKMPTFGHDDGEEGPQLVFAHTPAQASPPRELLAIAETQQIWLLERGVARQRLPLAEWRTLCTGLPVAGMQLHMSATIVPVPSSKSEQWENPVADLVVSEGGQEREVRLAAVHGQPLALADRKTFLTFEVRTDDPKAFRSHLTVIEDGKPVAEKTIVVNDPLSHKGYMFYQSNFRKEDPTYSGIQVVRDPGLGVVLAGFVMMAIGVVFIYYIRPRILAGGAHGH